MSSYQQTTGNEKLNNARESVNKSFSRYGVLGQSKRLVWANKRRFRTI